jgi:hypothetical protein
MIIRAARPRHRSQPLDGLWKCTPVERIAPIAAPLAALGRTLDDYAGGRWRWTVSADLARARVLEHLGRLWLGRAAEQLDALLSDAARGQPTYLDFLDTWEYLAVHAVDGEDSKAQE